MKRMIIRAGLLLLAATALLPGFPRAQEAPLLPRNARLAIAGDSITEQKIYSRYIETYLLACAGRRDISVFQFGWSGETAPEFAARMANDLGAFFKPTAMTTCYGMNDGRYRPYEETIGKNYEAGMRAIIKKARELGVTTVIVGSPGAVDTNFFQKSGTGAAEYNANLRQLGNLAREIAAEYKASFADVHAPLIEAMARAKAVLGENYDVCGRDGVHPGSNGHLVMAYAFLKALGCDGNIGEISVNRQGGTAVSSGHRVLSSTGGEIKLESERYPFCYDPDPRSSSSNRSILPFLPFNQELNRFILKVPELASARARVAWGNESKEFTAGQLASGINLAAEFDRTPFDGAFQKVQQSVAVQQYFQTRAIRSLVTNLRAFADDEISGGAEWQNAVNVLIQKLKARDDQFQAAVRAAIIPVQHTIVITPLP
ncbi:MAG TPA: SGNH/GDSL hydrolase family protein [bacterium]|uniref:GDSL-like Lipase/Acylhydrolase n=1 Tax=candidate division TA06 bacterium ADurb.Bin417 TaxID=1852828 RepID=A0A1V5MIF3_UNCT6|nr:MAG: GDSL-like Lipase/Acylhydrolase [candidate division TA06 bacterium ADurb.Bin417]HNQ34584.1 SGNH/GDSL hydrolase family protein [bacterium]HNS48504.1 SGNH/GDSL hydrolase family protein [bacterium]